MAYVGTPEIRFPWEGEQTPERLLPPSLDPGPPNPYTGPPPVAPPAAPPPAAPPPPMDMTSESIGFGAPDDPTLTGKLDPQQLAYIGAMDKSRKAERNASLINLLGTIFGGRDQPDIIESARQRPLEQYRMGQQAQAQQVAAGQQQAQARRQQNQDALKFAAGQRDAKTFEQGQADRGTAEQRAAELRDPASPGSQHVRAMLAKQYPGMVKTMGPEVFGQLTVEQTQTPTFQKQLVQADRLKYFKETDPSMQRRSALEGGATPGQMRALDGTPALTKQGGYEQKELGIQEPVRADFPEGWLESHPEVEAALKSIESTSFSRGKVNRQILESVRNAAKRAQEETEDASLNYTKELRAAQLPKTWAALQNVEDKIRAARVEHGDDIPGVGQTNFLTAPFGKAGKRLLSQEGRDVQMAVKELLDTRLRQATGAAAPPSEYETFAEILGVTAWNSDKDLLTGIEQARRYLNRLDDVIKRPYPDAALKWYDRKGGGRGWTKPLRLGQGRQRSKGAR